MTPSGRFALALVGSLVLWWSTFSAAMRGDVDVTTALLRYLIAYVVARIGAGILSAVVTICRVDPAAGRDGPRRRREDGVTDPGLVESENRSR